MDMTDAPIIKVRAEDEQGSTNRRVRLASLIRTAVITTTAA